MTKFKSSLLIGGLLFFLTAHSQERSSIGVGYSQSFLSVLKMQRGYIPIRPVRIMGLLADYNRRLHPLLINQYWGLRVSVQFYQGWWDLQNSVAYYQPYPTDFSIDKLDHVEAYFYVKQQLSLVSNNRFSLKGCLQAGPAFNFNSSLHIQEGLVASRLDNGTPIQVCTVYQEKRQPVWLPYLRTTASLAFNFSSYTKRRISLCPFLDMAFFQADRMSFETLPADPTYSSSGEFAWNRWQLGCTISFTK